MPTPKPLKERLALWVLATEDGSFLFHGNPNQNFPPYHVGGVEAIVRGDPLVYEHTRYGILVDGIGKLWNSGENVSKAHRVRPRRIMLEVRDYANVPTVKSRKGARHAEA